MNELFKPRPLALAIAVAVGSIPGASFGAAAGRIQFAFGEVSVQGADGASAPVKKGQEIAAGDTVVTERGRAQIKFTDGALVSLQPKTSFKIDDYNFAGSEDGSERSFFSLFRGGLRTITGAIGHRNRNAYRVTTPVATIGIRGTEYLVLLDDSGMIVTVGDGSIAVINDAGEVILTNGQTGRVIDKETAAQLLAQKPVVGPQEPSKDVRDEDDTGESQQDDEDIVLNITGDEGNPDDLIVGGEEEPPPPPPPVPTKLESGSGFSVASTFYSNNFEGPVSFLDTDSDATFVEGQMTGFTSNFEGGSFPSDIGDLDLVEAGSDRYIGWGRWSSPDDAFNEFTHGRTGGAADPDAFNDTNESMHYVVGKPTDLVALAETGEIEARYSVLSHTTPTDRNGDLGTFEGATFLLDIQDQQVAGTVAVTMDSFDYALFFNSPIGPGGFQSNAFVGSSSSCSFSCSGFVSGLVAGPAAERAGFVYHIEDSDESKDIFGAVTFFADPTGLRPPD